MIKRAFALFLAVSFVTTSIPTTFAADTLRGMTAETPATLSGLEEYLENQFRAELADKMRSNDELFLKELTQWAASFEKTQEELFAAMREIGPTLREVKGFRSFFEVVDEKGQPTGTLKAFPAMHQDGDWHRGVAVLLVAPDGRFILQERDDGRRDLSAGGHVELGDDLIKTALAEAQEEINFTPDPVRLKEIRNLLSSDGLFRKVGRKDYVGSLGYDPQGVYLSSSKEIYNREIDTLYLYRLTPEEFDSLQANYASKETRGLAIEPLERFLESFDQDPKRYGSGFQQYFSDQRVRSQILTVLQGLTSGLEEKKRAHYLGFLIDRVQTRLASERKIETGQLKSKIDQIKSGVLFTEGGVSYVPARAGRLIVIGDLHGDLVSLRKVIEQVGYDPVENKTLPPEKQLYLVFLGDYVLGGSNSLEVVIKVLELKLQDPDHIVALGGDHDREFYLPDSKVVKNSAPQWFFQDLTKILGEEQGLALHKRWNQLALGFPVMVVFPNGIVAAHSAPPSLEEPPQELAPKFRTRFQRDKGLLGMADPLIQEQVVSNSVWGSLEDPTNHKPDELITRSHRNYPDSPYQTGYWISRKSYFGFMEAIGGKIYVRGHYTSAPPEEVWMDGTFLTLQTFDYRSPDRRKAAVGKDVIARYAEFDLGRVYDKIDPAEVVRYLPWEAAGLEEEEFVPQPPTRSVGGIELGQLYEEIQYWGPTSSWWPAMQSVLRLSPQLTPEERKSFLAALIGDLDIRGNPYEDSDVEISRDAVEVIPLLFQNLQSPEDRLWGFRRLAERLTTRHTGGPRDTETVLNALLSTVMPDVLSASGKDIPILQNVISAIAQDRSASKSLATLVTMLLEALDHDDPNVRIFAQGALATFAHQKIALETLPASIGPSLVNMSYTHSDKEVVARVRTAAQQTLKAFFQAGIAPEALAEGAGSSSGLEEIDPTEPSRVQFDSEIPPHVRRQLQDALATFRGQLLSPAQQLWIRVAYPGEEAPRVEFVGSRLMVVLSRDGELRDAQAQFSKLLDPLRGRAASLWAEAESEGRVQRGLDPKEFETWLFSWGPWLNQIAAKYYKEAGDSTASVPPDLASAFRELSESMGLSGVSVDTWEGLREAVAMLNARLLIPAGYLLHYNQEGGYILEVIGHEVRAFAEGAKAHRLLARTRWGSSASSWAHLPYYAVVAVDRLARVARERERLRNDQEFVLQVPALDEVEFETQPEASSFFKKVAKVLWPHWEALSETAQEAIAFQETVQEEELHLTNGLYAYKVYKVYSEAAEVIPLLKPGGQLVREFPSEAFKPGIMGNKVVGELAARLATLADTPDPVGLMFELFAEPMMDSAEEEHFLGDMLLLEFFHEFVRRTWGTEEVFLEALGRDPHTVLQVTAKALYALNFYTEEEQLAILAAPPGLPRIRLVLQHLPDKAQMGPSDLLLLAQQFQVPLEQVEQLVVTHLKGSETGLEEVTKEIKPSLGETALLDLLQAGEANPEDPIRRAIEGLVSLENRFTLKTNQRIYSGDRTKALQFDGTRLSVYDLAHDQEILSFVPPERKTPESIRLDHLPEEAMRSLSRLGFMQEYLKQLEVGGFLAWDNTTGDIRLIELPHRGGGRPAFVLPDVNLERLLADTLPFEETNMYDWVKKKCQGCTVLLGIHTQPTAPGEARLSSLDVRELTKQGIPPISPWQLVVQHSDVALLSAALVLQGGQISIHGQVQEVKKDQLPRWVLDLSGRIRTGLEEIESVTMTEVGPPIQTFTGLNEALSSFTSVEVPASVGSRRVLIVTPDAVGRVLTAASLFSGEPVLLELIARDAGHQQRILAGLEQLALPGVRVHDLQAQFGGNLDKASTELQLPHWQAGRETLVVTALTLMGDIGKFLGMTLPESVKRGLEAIIDRSQSLWM